MKKAVEVADLFGKYNKDCKELLAKTIPVYIQTKFSSALEALSTLIQSFPDYEKTHAMKMKVFHCWLTATEESKNALSNNNPDDLANI
mmetsp:Transcript_926/g.941  ORF Transcript_926/g.941 Transcript_926/m.941 type:complete len:88 (+) Transcript_926:864-1127(+)